MSWERYGIKIHSFIYIWWRKYAYWSEIRNLLEKEVEKKDVRIDSIKLEKEDNNLFLRIVIDSDEIIDVDKCVEVTNIINPLLDEKDLIKESYILDVSTKEKGR